MAADTLGPAILDYVHHGAYPESEHVSSAEVTGDALETALQQLRRSQEHVKRDIRSVSQASARDVDTWITRARELQADIAGSRETARQIVAEHEQTKQLRAEAAEAARKARLVAQEVAFAETLGAVLEQVRHASGVLDSVRDAAVTRDVAVALQQWERAEESMGGLEGLGDSKARGLLQRRVAELRAHLTESATECWNGLIQVDHEQKSITIHSHRAPDVGDVIDFDVVLRAATRLHVFDHLVKKLSKDLQGAVFTPTLTVDDNGQQARVEINAHTLSCNKRVDDTRPDQHFFADLQQIIHFLATHLPSSLGSALSAILIPTLSTRLEDQWLDPSVPTDIKGMPAFRHLLRNVTSLADAIDHAQWHGSQPLHDWVANAPRTWLAKRREAVLGDARNLVFTALRETKVVERVETQMVSKDDHHALRGGGGDGAADDDERGWDAWDEPEEEQKPAGAPTPAAPSASAEEDDGDAWGAWDAEDSSPQHDQPPAPPAEADDDDDDAWGAWGDDAQSAQIPTSPPRKAPPMPAATRPVNGAAPSTPKQREMTLRETFTVTAIPDALLDILQSIVADAQTLAGPSDAYSPVAPAATALYTLPTLALAIYRATAPTAYTHLPAGNMLIYNDSLRLADQLRAWQTSQPAAAAARLRLDHDVTALETFAKRAYSSEMDAQRTVLRDLLDGAQGFACVTTPPFKHAAESAVEEVVARLRDLHALWRPILPPSVLLQALGSLLATTLAQMIREIEDLGDIGEEDSHQLRRLMDTIATAKSLFRREGEGEHADMTFVYCPNWLKFLYLAEILESSLADIKYMWVESELSLEFDAEEVVELIEGLFADSEVRRRTIGEVRRRVGGGG